jgi:multiple sugar transport system permease protein
MLHTEFGVVNYILTSMGLLPQPVGWLTDPDIVMPALVAINVWKLFPFVAVMVLAGLQAVPEELYEAARVDGASFLREVWHVMLPHLRPVLAALTLLLTIWGLNAITIVYTVTRGGPANRTLIVPIQIFRHAFESFQFHQTAALSAMYFVFTLGLVVLYLRVLRSQEGGRS